MKNLPEIRIGLIVGSTDWLPVDLAIEKRKALFLSYVNSYGQDDVYECPVCITDNEVSVKRAMKDVQKAECNAICIYYANYGPELTGTLFASEFNGPVMFIGASEEGNPPYIENRCDAQSGFINACYALSLRKTDVYIPDRPIGTVAECAERLHEFASIARVAIGVEGLKVISFEPRPTSYLASLAPTHLLYDLGVELASYSELELLNSYSKHDGDSRIGSIVGEMAQELRLDEECDTDILQKLAQYELTVKDWVRTHKGDRKYVSLTSTCWPAFPINYGFVPCYVNSRMTKDMFPVACEADVYGALTEYIGQCISNESVTILNINNNVPQAVYDEQVKGQSFNGKQYDKGDLFIGYHCGVTPSDRLASCQLECHYVNKRLIGEEQSNGTIQGEIRPGAITMFRIQGMADGKLRAYVAQGQILPVSIETYGGWGVVAIPEMERFLRNVVIEKHFPNHAVIVFGHFGRELSNALKLLGIHEIYYNHPKGALYEGENLFDTYQDWY